MFKRFVGHNVGIDLGTSTTLIYVKGQGIVLNEPTVVAIEVSSNKTIAVGEEAKKMLGRTPEAIRAIRPMKDGVIADFEVTEELLRYFIHQIQVKGLFTRPMVVVAVPSGITAVERRAVRDSVDHAGASDVWLVAEPVAAAIGVGLPIESPAGSMIVDIGGGTTEIAVIALSDIVCNKSVRTAGDEMDSVITEHLKKKYNLLVGEITSEMIKIKVGSAIALKTEQSMEVKGRDLISGLPKTIKVNSKEIREALKEPITTIVTAIRSALEFTPPELASDIIDYGITLNGGGALLRGISDLIAKETGLKVECAESPVECVVKGTGKILDQFSRYSKMLLHGA
ncbi:rod shape-determining protein [candidate division WOR-3 bacterium]|nr:rod shape-determining protein [candidate division WOR-3 bacterium]